MQHPSSQGRLARIACVAAAFLGAISPAALAQVDAAATEAQPQSPTPTPWTHVVTADVVALYVAPPKHTVADDLANIRVALLRGDRCRPAGTPATVWTCIVEGREFTGYVDKSTLVGALSRVAEPALDVWDAVTKMRAQAKNSVLQLQRVEVLAHFAAYRLASAECSQPQQTMCYEAVSQRLNLIAMRDAFASFLKRPASLRSFDCRGAGSTSACLTATLGAGLVGVSYGGKTTYFVWLAAVDADRIHVISGAIELQSTTVARAFEEYFDPSAKVSVLRDDVVDDPLFPGGESLRKLIALPSPMGLGAAAPTRTRRFIVPTDNRDRVRLRRLLADDEGLIVLCRDRAIKVAKPVPTSLAVGDDSWDMSDMHAVYDYKLPCRAIAALSDDVTEAKIGPWKKLTGSGLPPSSTPRWSQCTTAPTGRRGCILLWKNDINGDGVADALFSTHGEMGCGGYHLSISQKDGTWSEVAYQDWYC